MLDIAARELKGHDILALERFADRTRHMVELVVMSADSPYGELGDHMRLFLSDEGYGQAQEAQRRRQLKIRRHARVIEGHILFDRPRKKKH